MNNELITKRAWLEIDLNKLSRNIAEIRAHINSGCRIMAVVKANGYGQGAVTIARYLSEYEGVTDFGVAGYVEALELRQAGIKGEILILSSTAPSLVKQLIDLDITQTVFSPEYAELMNSYAEKAGGKIKVHIKIDTGMTRIGFDCRNDGEIEQVASVYKLPNLIPTGIFSHFSSSDDPNDGAEEYSLNQIALFEKAVNSLKAMGCEVGLRHICNTGGVQKYPQAHFDMVRCGAVMSGYNTACGIPKWNIEPISSLKATVISLRDIDEGTAISYSRTFVSDKPMRVAVLSIGYADGYLRSLSRKGRVILHGKWARELGNVCMDQMMVDVTDIPEVEIGDAAIIIGSEGELCQTADDLGEQAGSCMHEILSRLSLRLQRIYFKDGKIFEIV